MKFPLRKNCGLVKEEEWTEWPLQHSTDQSSKLFTKKSHFVALIKSGYQELMQIVYIFFYMTWFAVI